MSSPTDIIGNINQAPPAPVQAPNGQQQAGDTGTIRNISQTVQEREIIKTAPDVVVFIDGLPYLINLFVNDPKTGNQSTYVNFNDHVVSFQATYDTDIMVPNCTLQLQVPNYQKFLYQMPGGNNLLQTMAQIQVYAKGYYMAATGDTVYRRVFKGVTSYIGYNDNGRTLEISIQCHGIMHLLEKMQTNIHPSTNTTSHTGVSQTIWQSKYGNGNCFEVLAQVFLDALRSDMFQFGSLFNQSMGNSGKGNNPFWQAVRRGYMAKWQATLTNMVKDVHIFGPYKSLGQNLIMKKDPNWGAPDKNIQSAAVSKRSTQSEKDLVAQYATYYGNVSTYYPFRNLTALDLKNNVIVNRLDIIREITSKMDYEAYQDVDGKIIIKPPLYNLDVVNLGARTKQTQTNPGSSQNSLTNPATAIYEQNNPFVIYLSEILTEQESEDQSAIRRTRTTVVGNALKNLGNSYDPFHSPVGEYIDVTKMAKFGLREEPLHQVPWIGLNDMPVLFAHAASETVRANRGYRTYTVTIPMRPELKLGFPVFIPHRDMYGYVKSISLNFNIGGTATMTVTCDSIRRRVVINTTQTSGSGNAQQTFQARTPAPNLVYQWTNVSQASTEFDLTNPNPDQSPNAAQVTAQQQEMLNAGAISGVSNNNQNLSNLVGTSATLTNPLKNPDGTSTIPTPDQLKIYSIRSQNLVNKLGNQYDTAFATYVIKNDNSKQQNTVNPATGHGYFDKQRPADLSYIQTLCGNNNTHANSVIPFTDDKGYEVIAPFPWGRWVDLNTALKTFTEQGWLQQPTDVDGNPTTPDDLQILQNTDAFLFAGLGTPTGAGDPSTQLLTALNQQQNRVGGSLSGTYAPVPNQVNSTTTTANANNPQNNISTPNSPTVQASQQSIPQSDATVIILHYDPAQPGSFADNQLLNDAQPEDVFAEQLLMNTQNTQQQLVDVLVSGVVSPTPAVQEALLVANTPAQQPKNVQLLQTITEGEPGQ